jgi:mono/diheme cytochrome c family protein
MLITNRLADESTASPPTARLTLLTSRWLAALLAELAIALFSSSLLFAAEADDARYQRWCARCHGANGDGRGPAAAALRFNGRPPRDFRQGLFRFKSTPPGQPPSVSDVVRSVRDGLPGTAMPYFGDLLSEEEIRGVAGVVLGFGSGSSTSNPIDLGAAPEDGEAARRRGAELYRELGCDRCHGERGAGDGPAGPEQRNDDGSLAPPTDLTRPWRFRGGGEPVDLALRLAAGVPGTPMPSYLEAASPADLWRLAYYVRSLARAPSLRAAAIEDALRPPGLSHSPEARGEYLAKSGTCFLCHAQMNPDGSYAEGSFGAGGMRVEIRYLGTTYSRNLTPDRASGLGDWDGGDFRRVFRAGRSRDGRMLNALDMPWTILAELEDRDVDALFAYLRTLPAVRNSVPAPRAAGLLEGLIDKAVALALGSHDKAYLGFHVGNAGLESASPGAVRNPRAPIWLAAICAAAALVELVGGSRGGRRRLTLAILITIPFVYAWPPVTYLPADLLLAKPPYRAIAPWIGMPVLRPPPPSGEVAEPGLRALVDRGRYVAAAGTCSLCHTAGPSWIRLWAPYPDLGGGMKVNWRVFGTTYSRNLTSDRDTGLGGWSAAEIRRAITSGISRDGRIMHWQAMPWDHFSNFMLEDLEALVAYLQSLPPAYSKIPPPEPPRPDDLPGDSFWLGYSGEYRP